MLFSDRDFSWFMAGEELDIDPFYPENLQPASYDVMLDEDLIIFPKWAGWDERKPVIDPTKPQPLMGRKEHIPLEGFALQPGQFVLGSTIEKVKLGLGVAARLEGKSSLGRLGLMVHSTAGFIDPGFEGTITLELSNVNQFPILLQAGMLVGQLCVFKLNSDATAGYGDTRFSSKYQGQRGPTASKPI